MAPKKGSAYRVKFWFRFPATLSSDATRAQRRRSLLLAVVCISVLPLAWRGTSCGQDLDFHLQSWLDVVDGWHHGSFYPHWAVAANYLAGEPRFVFYPPMSWILGGALGAILPWSWTPVAYALIALLGGGFAFRSMAGEWMSADSAAIAACLYVINPYMMFVVYERGALAELLAATWIPLLVLFALRERAAVVPLTLTVGALWLTDPPAAVIGCYALALLVAVAALQERSHPKRPWKLVGRSAVAVPLGLALAGFWLVPAVWEEPWVEIHRAIGPLMRVEDSFLFGFVPTTATAAQERFDAIYHNGVLATVSWIAVALILLTAFAAWFSRRRRNALWLPLLAASAAVVFLQFRLSDWLWRTLPEMKYLQFPWRWLLVLELAFAALAGLAFAGEQKTRRAVAQRAGVLLTLACCMAALSAFVFWQPCDEEDNIAAQVAAFHTTGYAGSDEYTPTGANNEKIQQGLPVIRLLHAPDAEEARSEDNPDWTSDPVEEMPAAIALTRADAEQITATVGARSDGFAVLRLLDYPAWRVTVNGTELSRRPHREDGLMVVPLPAGTNRIEVRWKLTWDQQAGILLSLIALAITLALAWKGRIGSDAGSVS